MRNALLLTAVLLSAPSQEAPAPVAPVVLGKRTVLILKAPGPGGLPARDRAVLVEHHLARFLADPRIGPEHIRHRSLGRTAEVQIGSTTILRVTPQDAAVEGTTPAELAELWAQLIRERFAEVKHRNFTLRLLMKYVLALSYPLVLIVLLMGLAWLRRQALVVVLKLEDKTRLRFAGIELVSLRIVKLALRALVTAASWALAFLLLYAFVLATFYYFPVTRSFALRMTGVAGEAFRGFGAWIFGPFVRLILIGVVVAAANLILKALARLFDAVAAGQLRIPSVTTENADTVEFLVKGFVLLGAFVGAVLLLPSTGAQVARGALLLFGLAVALASVRLLRNALAGFLLAFLDTHRRGVRIKVEGVEALVLRRGLLFSSVRFPDGRRATVPNERLLRQPVFPARSRDVAAWHGRLHLPDTAKLSEVQRSLEEWADRWGDDARVHLKRFEDGEVCFELLVPFLAASEEVFLAAAHDDLVERLGPDGPRLLAFHPLR